MKKQIRFLEKIDQNGFFQMALDEALFEFFSLEEGQENQCLLRFYTFSKPSITIGCFQRFKYFPEEYQNSFTDIVRRITGGGLVVHQNSLTFSLIASKSFLIEFEKTNEAYRFVHRIIQDAFQASGITLDVKTGKDLKEKKKNFLECFKEPVCSDLMLQFQKIVGGAQKREKNVFLHQGSIDLSFFSAEKEWNVSLEKNIKKSFRKFLDADSVESKITQKEEERARQLEREKYRTDDWLLRY